MKLVKTASGKTNIKMSQKEWQSIGKKAGWMNKSAAGLLLIESIIMRLAQRLVDDENRPDINDIDTASSFVRTQTPAKFEEYLKQYNVQLFE